MNPDAEAGPWCAPGKMGALPNSSANTAPTAHMSTPCPYFLAPNSNSGARNLVEDQESDAEPPMKSPPRPGLDAPPCGDLLRVQLVCGRHVHPGETEVSYPQFSRAADKQIGRLEILNRHRRRHRQAGSRQ